MTQKNILGGMIALFLVIFLGAQALFTVDQRSKALVLQFGELVKVHETPGLKMKTPFIQTVVQYDARLLEYNLPVIEVTAGDQKRLVVDMYVRYRIKDVLIFFKTVRDRSSAENRLSTIVEASMRRVVGEIQLAELLSVNRNRIMDDIKKEVVEASKSLGLEVIDVRIIRADLPQENSEAIFRRMETERRQEAKQIRAEGEEQSQKLKADADRKRTELLAEATSQSEVLRGEGDAIATDIYAQAFGQDPDFYEYYRTLEAYKESFKANNTTFMLSKDGGFFRYFGR